MTDTAKMPRRVPDPGDTERSGIGTLGHPRLHLRRTSSTNDRARELAIAGAPHGTLVTASEQTAGRGRQGRRWEAPAGSALLMSVVLRSTGPHAPLPLLAAVAVCDVVGPEARVKWPNDILFPSLGGSRRAKLAGILTEARPQEGWAVMGIGVNVAVRLEDLPVHLRETAATLGRPAETIETALAQLLVALERRLADSAEATLAAWRELDALQDHEISWTDGSRHHQGRAEGIDTNGRLLVALPAGGQAVLEAGEVHLAGLSGS
jgi:BirA family transcriptional regulator, biotin operon repressor / biotin---[acetyl-CoA-carboxylase] ligase